MAVIRKAVSGGHIQTNFPKPRREKPKETIRDFLTLEELQALAATPCELDYLKNASLFSALTGLRFSDIEKLRWEEVKETPEGYNIEFRVQKTGDMERQPISDKAYFLLGVRRMPASRVFPELKYSYWLNTKLREWVAAAEFLGAHHRDQLKLAWGHALVPARESCGASRVLMREHEGRAARRGRHRV
jgi:integrase